jgi:branched-chain amino acid aminotransferase
MSTLININGTITDPEHAYIPVFDRGFLYGDSVFEVIRTYKRKPFALRRHLKRLKNSAHRLNLELPPLEWIVEQFYTSIEKAGNEESYCRIVVTRGSGPLTLDPTHATSPMTVFIVTALEPYPDWMYEKGISLAVPGTKRKWHTEKDPAVKSGNYLNSVLAIGEAIRTGYDDALLLDIKGRVSEATTANVFMHKDGKLYTPHLKTGLLAGVTRELIIEIASENNIPCEECIITLKELLNADEVMVTSTIREVIPVKQIDDNIIGDGTPGPIAKTLRKLFQDKALDMIEHTVPLSKALLDL